MVNTLNNLVLFIRIYIIKAMQIQNRVTKEIYFITSTVVDWVDVFTRPVYNHVIIESLG